MNIAVFLIESIFIQLRKSLFNRVFASISISSGYQIDIIIYVINNTID